MQTRLIFLVERPTSADLPFLVWCQNSSAHKLAASFFTCRHSAPTPSLACSASPYISEIYCVSGATQVLPHPLLSTNRLSCIYWLSANSIYVTHVLDPFLLTPDSNENTCGWRWLRVSDIEIYNLCRFLIFASDFQIHPLLPDLWKWIGTLQVFFLCLLLSWGLWRELGRRERFSFLVPRVSSICASRLREHLLLSLHY